MKTINDGGPAFPRPSLQQDNRCDTDRDMAYAEQGASGMTLRDYFAAKALQGMVSNATTLAKFTEDGGLTDLERNVAKVAYMMADHMLAARKP